MTDHIAQINIGTLLYELDDPRLGEFMGNLDRVNALAEASPGIVWRLKDESGNAAAIRVFENPRMAINMSVWTSIAALQHLPIGASMCGSCAGGWTGSNPTRGCSWPSGGCRPVTCRLRRTGCPAWPYLARTDPPATPSHLRTGFPLLNNMLLDELH